jgi:Flp pilus assembly protein TadB
MQDTIPTEYSREDPTREGKEGNFMNVERWIRVIAGTFVLVSLGLGWYVSPWFLLFTAFVGLNLFQSGWTNWCLMEKILKKIGVPER